MFQMKQFNEGLIEKVDAPIYLNDNKWALDLKPKVVYAEVNSNLTLCQSTALGLSPDANVVNIFRMDDRAYQTTTNIGDLTMYANIQDIQLMPVQNIDVNTIPTGLGNIQMVGMNQAQQTQISQQNQFGQQQNQGFPQQNQFGQQQNQGFPQQNQFGQQQNQGFPQQNQGFPQQNQFGQQQNQGFPQQNQFGQQQNQGFPQQKSFQPQLQNTSEGKFVPQHQSEFQPQLLNTSQPQLQNTTEGKFVPQLLNASQQQPFQPQFQNTTEGKFVPQLLNASQQQQTDQEPISDAVSNESNLS